MIRLCCPYCLGKIGARLNFYSYAEADVAGFACTQCPALWDADGEPIEASGEEESELER